MTRQIVLRSSIKNHHRRQPLLSNQSPAGSLRIGNQSQGGGGGSRRFAEVAGGTAAECAAICCCCPCGIMKFLVLAVYKLPAGLCRKALKNKRIKRLKKNGLIHQQQSKRKRRCKCGFGCDENEFQIHSLSFDHEWVSSSDDDDDCSSSNEINKNSAEILLAKEVEDLENEMWNRFNSTGFWRSLSQRDDLKELPIISLDD